jgi:virulence factor
LDLIVIRGEGVNRMNQVKVGVIGLGRMGQQHCRVYSSLRRAHLVGVCDINPEVGRQVARRFDVPFFSNPDELIDSVEAISLVTPTPFHYDLALKCIERGMPVLIEKPIAETLDQAEKLVKAAEAKGLICQIGHIERFNPAYMELRNVLDEMSVLAINFRRLSAYSGSNTDVDVVLDLMIHDTDLVLNLVGEEPVSISASGLSAYGKAVDYAVAQLRFQHGPLVTLTASRLTEEKIRAIEVTAKEAFLEANLLNKTVTVHRRTVSQYLNHNSHNVKYRQESILESVLVPVVEPLLSELQHFIDCVSEGKQPTVKPRDGFRALRLAVEIRDAIHANIVDFSQPASIPVELPVSMTH